MSFEPQNSRRRKRRLMEGRARVVLLIATASTMGAGTAAVAGTVDNEVAAEMCNVTTAVTTVVTLPDGQVFDCEALLAEQTSTDAEGTTTQESSTTTTETTATTETTTTETTTTAVEEVKPATDERPAAEQQPAAEQAAPEAKQEDAAPEVADNSVTAQDVGAQEAKKATPRSKNAKRNGKKQRRGGRKSHGKKHNHVDHGVPGDAITYAMLPAEWTSLQPIALPAVSAGDFPIPPFLLPLYQAAGAQYGVPWEVLASINEIETAYGENAGVSSAGALGWMQFIRSSWSRWGVDADADGRKDPRHPVDAIFAAGRYLRAAGATLDLPKAVFAYNHADWYVERVLHRARELAGLDPELVAALTEDAIKKHADLYFSDEKAFGRKGPRAGQMLLMSKGQLIRYVLRSKAIDVYPSGRRDIADGRINRRVLATLAYLAKSGLHPTVSSLESGHSLLTKSGNISAHSYGHAVDVSALNGTPILGHQGAGSITEKALRELLLLNGSTKPNQIITLMTVENAPNTIAMGDHDDHIHIGFPRVAPVAEVVDEKLRARQALDRD